MVIKVQLYLNLLQTSLLSHPFSAASLSQSVSGVTVANLQTPAPQLDSKVEFRILFPEASEIALADIIGGGPALSGTQSVSVTTELIFENDMQKW